MTAGTVVITGGILATVILLCIIAVLCYCRLQVLPGGWGRGAHEGGPVAGGQPPPGPRPRKEGRVRSGRKCMADTLAQTPPEGSVMTATWLTSPRASQTP